MCHYAKCITDVLIGFTKEVSMVNEDGDNTTVCVEVCDGILKRDVVIYVDFMNETAECKLIVHDWY